MAIILDSNVLIELERNNKEIIEKVRAISKFHKTKPCVASVSISEIMCGAFKQSTKRQLTLLENFKDYNILNNSFSSSMVMANFAHVLHKKGKKIPIIDLIIASITIENDLNLVTMDSHFKRIPGLDVLYIGK